MDELVGKFGRRARLNEPMSRHTTFRIGGPADVLVDVETRDELRMLLGHARERSLPVTVLGRGANVLVADEGIRGVVVRLAGEFREIAFAGDGQTVDAGAGTSLGRLVAETVKVELSAFTWAAGIPGTVGGAVLTNAGSWGHAMSEFVETLTVMKRDGSEVTVPGTEVAFDYRSARLPVPDAVVCGVTLRLTSIDGGGRDASTLKAEYQARKLRTQPLKLASAGCVFRNPPGTGAGELIDRAGLKGLRVGGAVVSAVHANYLVNEGDATAADVKRLIALVRERVKEKFDVTLEPELILL